MVTSFKDPLMNFKTEMTLKRIEKIKDRLYEVKYEGKDIHGSSNFQGLIALSTTKEISFKFIKIYSKLTSETMKK